MDRWIMTAFTALLVLVAADCTKQTINAWKFEKAKPKS